MRGEIAKLLRLQLILQEFIRMRSQAHGFGIPRKMYGDITIRHTRIVVLVVVFSKH